MPFTFVYRTAIAKLRESAVISAVRYSNLTGIVSPYKKVPLYHSLTVSFTLSL